MCCSINRPNENSIGCIKPDKQVIYGNPVFLKASDYDLLQVWFINLGDCESVEQGSLLRLLDIAFDKRNNFTNEDKLRFLYEEYNIRESVVAREVEGMNAYVLDYAERYAEKYAAEAVKAGEARGIEKGLKATALKMQEKGFPTTVIAECVNVSEDTVKQWLK